MAYWQDRLFALVFLAIAVLALAGAGPAGRTASPAPLGRAPETRTVPVEGGSYAEVNAAGLVSMLEKKDFLLINVHVPYEGEIEGTDLFLPFDAVEANLDRLPADRSARLVLYCRSGRMSGIAARTLVKLGYTDVWNLEGGMISLRVKHFYAHEMPHEQHMEHEAPAGHPPGHMK